MGRRRRESRPVGGGGGEGGTRPVSLIPTQGASGLEKGHAEDCQDFPHLHNNNVDFHFFEYKNQKYFISSLQPGSQPSIKDVTHPNAMLSRRLL